MRVSVCVRGKEQLKKVGREEGSEKKVEGAEKNEREERRAYVSSSQWVQNLVPASVSGEG